MIAKNAGIDPRDLWVELKGSNERFYLGDSSTTVHGRMYAFAENGKSGVGFSKDEVTDASLLARAWIDGFLAGNGFSLADYLGVDEGAIYDVGDDDPSAERWRVALQNFRETGMPPFLGTRPVDPFPNEYPQPFQPWLYVAEEVWCWFVDEFAWRPADSQPSVVWSGWALEGTVCATRDLHDDEKVDEFHLYCTSCGRVTLTEPD